MILHFVLHENGIDHVIKEFIFDDESGADYFLSTHGNVKSTNQKSYFYFKKVIL